MVLHTSWFLKPDIFQSLSVVGAFAGSLNLITVPGNCTAWATDIFMQQTLDFHGPVWMSSCHVIGVNIQENYKLEIILISSFILELVRVKQGEESLQCSKSDFDP